jgi:N-glycosylase/DNA lyase
LRELGFGYRAKYIAETAKIVANQKPEAWLESLTNPENPAYRKLVRAAGLPQCTYKEAHEQLLELTGVGPKVADCVCLMGLGWGEAVPVDTHVWQIAQRDYKFGKTRTKTFNKAMYDAVGDHFRELWGNYAGWAHSVLFTADLRAFSDRSPKKEEPRTLKVEEQVHTSEQTTPSGKKRKIINTVVKVKHEMEDDGDMKLGDTKIVEASVKRRRTRSSR